MVLQEMQPLQEHRVLPKLLESHISQQLSVELDDIQEDHWILDDLHQPQDARQRLLDKFLPVSLLGIGNPAQDNLLQALDTRRKQGMLRQLEDKPFGEEE